MTDEEIRDQFNRMLKEMIEYRINNPKPSHPLEGRTVRHKNSGSLMKIDQVYEDKKTVGCTFMGSCNGYLDGKQIEWYNSFCWDSLELIEDK